MSHFLRKIAAKFKVHFYPAGQSVIKSGFGKGLTWLHQIKDTRYLSGTYEEEIAGIICEKSKTGYSIIDVGANAGYYSMLANKFRQNSTTQQILSVEPMPENIKILKHHFELNKISNVELFELALSDKKGEIEFSNTPNLAANTYKSESNYFNEFPKIKVETTTLDEICLHLETDRLLVKIDVEGAELDVLYGALNTLKRIKPDLILATHECHVQGVEENCLKFLKNLNYTCRKVDEHKFVKGQADYFCSYSDFSKS